ncbi:MAG TPA: DUF1801 domain-containing protein [Acidimicrobiia bacterium]|nr:DUF1801 domain-containing protein [Acidimicrobiia bacterium]
MTAPSHDVDEFLAALPEREREVLQSLRQTIRAAAPDAAERIGYGVPAFYYKGRPLVSYGAGKSHCAFYVQSPAVIEAHREALQGQDTAKGTVRFKADRPLPADLVQMLVRARLEETDAAGRGEA